jgi:tetratricopeptide (TPR) repeat protein
MPAFVSGDDGQKIAWVEKALQLHEEVSRLRPDDDMFPSMSVAQCIHNLAATLQSANRPREAELYYHRAIEQMSKVAERHPEEPMCYLGLADSYCNLGLLHHGANRIGEAQADFERADSYFDWLMKLGSSPQRIAVSRSALALNWGNLYLETGQIQKATELYNRGTAWCENILSREPDLAPIRENALKLHGSKANIYDAQKRYAEAAEEWQSVAEFSQGPNRLLFRIQRCLSLAHAGDFVRSTTEASAILVEPACTQDILYNGACVFALSRKNEEAVELLSKLHNKGYFENPDHLRNLATDPDLDSIRMRADFSKLLNRPLK